MDINESLNFLRLSAFEKDLVNSNISFAYADDSIVKAGLLFDEKKMYMDYALEVYNLCTGGLNLGCQKTYDRLLKVISGMRADIHHYRTIYSYNGKGTWKSFKNSQKFRMLSNDLENYSSHIEFDITHTSSWPTGFIKFACEDNERIHAYLTPSYKDRKNPYIFGTSDEMLFMILLKTNEIMESYGFYLDLLRV